MKRHEPKLKISPKLKRAIIRLSLSTLVLIPVFVGAFLILRTLGVDNLSRDKIQELVSSAGSSAPLMFILITFLQVSFISIPSAPVILGGSYIFGALESFVYSYIGTILGASFAFFLGRKIGRPFINWVAGDKETVDELLLKLHGKEKIILFMMFLLPMFPDDLLCAIAGMLSMSYGLFLGMQLSTRIVAIGGTLFLFSGEILPFEGWGLWAIGGIVLAIALMFVVMYIVARKKRANANKSVQNTEASENQEHASELLVETKSEGLTDLKADRITEAASGESTEAKTANA